MQTLLDQKYLCYTRDCNFGLPCQRAARERSVEMYDCIVRSSSKYVTSCAHKHIYSYFSLSDIF